MPFHVVWLPAITCVWGTCSQCTTESDSQTSTFRSSLCRPHRAIWDPHKRRVHPGKSGRLERPKDAEGLMPAVLWLQMMPATSNSPRTSEDPFCERDEIFWNYIAIIASVRALQSPSLKRSSNCLKPKPLWELARILAGQKSTPREPQAPNVAGFQTAKITILDTPGILNRWTESSNSSETIPAIRDISWQCAGCMSMGRASDQGAKSIH